MNFPGSGLPQRWALLSEKPWLFGSWRKFTLITVVLLIIPALLLLILATYTISPRLQRQTYADLELWGALFGRQISEEFEGLSRYVESFASRPTSVRAASTGDLHQTELQLEALAQSNPKLSRAVFVSTNGTLVAAFPRDAAVRGADFSGRDWVRGALHSEGPYVSGVYRRATAGSEEVISIACRVAAPHGITLGLIAAQYRLSELNAWIDRTLDSTPIMLVLADQRGHAIYDRSGSLECLRERSARLASKSGDSPKQFEATLDSDNVLVSHHTIPFLGWSLLLRLFQWN